MTILFFSEASSWSQGGSQAVGLYPNRTAEKGYRLGDEEFKVLRDLDNKIELFAE